MDRPEGLWEGEFGDAYLERNRHKGEERVRFWRGLLERFAIGTVLEVGCSNGINLRSIADAIGVENTVGIDVNRHSVELLKEAQPDIDARVAAGNRLDFEDASFDLVFTAGVLMILEAEDLEQTMSEMVRCARRYVMCSEVFAEEEVLFPYRGDRFFKRDYEPLFLERFPDLRLVERRLLSPAEGFDDHDMWLFEKSG